MTARWSSTFKKEHTMTTTTLKWTRQTGGDATIYRYASYTITSSAARTDFGRTGWKSGSVVVYVDPDPTATIFTLRTYGKLVRTFSRVSDAKAWVEARVAQAARA